MQKLVAMLGIIILGLAAVWFFLLTNESPAVPESPEQPSAELPENDASDTTSNEEPEAEAGDTPEPVIGNDAGGMEFPTPDNEAPTAKVFNLSGTNFAFDVEEIRVEEGDVVTINFESADGFHDWVVDEFDAATAQVRPGTPTSVTFVASKTGAYEYYCSVGSHRANGMVGTLIVE